MKVLVLGDSATLGKGITNQAERWPLLLPAEVERLSGEPCEVVDSTFYAANSEAPAYAASRAAQAKPDIIVLIVGAYGFRLRSVHAKVQRRFGKRAGRFVRWVEEKSEGTGGITVQPRWRQRAFSGGRALAHRLIGTEPLTTPEEAYAIYKNTFSLLARQEGVRIITARYSRPDALVGNAPGGSTQWVNQLSQDPGLAKTTTEFNRLIDAEISARHFDQAFYSDYQQRLERPHDGLRIDGQGHRLWAVMIAETITGKFEWGVDPTGAPHYHR